MRKLLLLCFLWSALGASSQSDVLVLKQKNQIVETWIKGSIISFQFSSHQWIQGYVRNMRNDSLLIDMFTLTPMLNQFGLPVTDTSHMGLLKLHVKEIYGMPKRNLSSGIISNGALFQLGGGGYIFLNVFNSLIHGDAVFGSSNLPSLGIATGVFGLGVLLQSTRKTQVVLGKKYRLEILHVAPA